MKLASLWPLLAPLAVADYKGDDEWPALTKALDEYPAFHAKELKKIKNGDASARWLVLNAYHGLGNRERAMMSGFAFALVNRLAFFVEFDTAGCDKEADKGNVKCQPADLQNMYKGHGFDWRALTKCLPRHGRTKPKPTDVCLHPGYKKVKGGVVDLRVQSEEKLIRRGVAAIGPRVLMHSDHTLLKYIVCDKAVRKSGLFPPDFFAAQRQIEAFLLQPRGDVRDRAQAALKRAGGCAVGLHLRGPGAGHHRDAGVFLDDLAPALAAAPGGLFVLGDGNNEQKKKDIVKQARRRGMNVVDVEGSGQKGGLMSALAENLVLSSCAMLVPTTRSSFFSIAAVRAAARRDVRDAFFCGVAHNRSVPLPGPPCLSHCMFNTTCPRLSEGHEAFVETQIPKSEGLGRC